MKFSTGLQRVFEDAQLIAQRYACDHLEMWHILLAFVINHDTVAGAVFGRIPNEYFRFRTCYFCCYRKSIP